MLQVSGTNFCTKDFAPPKPEFGPEFWETNFGRPNFGPEFLGRIFWACFFQQRAPQKNLPSRNSPSKIQPRNRAKKFTLHLCRAFWLSKCMNSSHSSCCAQNEVMLQLQHPVGFPENSVTLYPNNPHPLNLGGGGSPLNPRGGAQEPLQRSGFGHPTPLLNWGGPSPPQLRGNGLLG